MLKSQLIKHLQSNLNEYGDGEIQVEVVSDLNFSGKVYEIIDVTNAVGFNLEADYITCWMESDDEDDKTNEAEKCN